MHEDLLGSIRINVSTSLVASNRKRKLGALFFQKVALKRLWPLFLILHVVALWSCGEHEAEKMKKAIDPNVPFIHDIRYVGQSPKSSEILIFELNYEAEAKILVDFIEVSIIGASQTILDIPTAAFMFQNQIMQNAKNKTIRFTVELDFKSLNEPSHTQRIDFEFRVCKFIRKCGNFFRLPLLIKRRA